MIAPASRWAGPNIAPFTTAPIGRPRDLESSAPNVTKERERGFRDPYLLYSIPQEDRPANFVPEAIDFTIQGV
jgi:hypothetical protein